MSLSAMSRALRFDIPKRLHERAGRVYLDAVTQLYGAMQGETPVDTGYLRASLAATLMGEAPPAMAPKPKKEKTKRGTTKVQFRRGPSAAKQVPFNVNANFATLPAITIGYRASYAQYVEDKRHMTKMARARWPHFLKSAIANASD